MFHPVLNWGFRCSAATAYLKPARGRANLTVETNAHVTRIDFQGEKAVGVTFEQDKKTISVQSNREVVLSAGAIQSPQLLQLSGIGSADLLSSLQIPILKNLPGVGENLQDHLILRLIYK